MKSSNKTIKEQVDRFNAIIGYTERLKLNETPYRFYNEAEEDTAEPIEPEQPEQPIEPDQPMEPEQPAGQEIEPVGDDNLATNFSDQAPMDDETIEVDITDLVNDTNDIKLKTQDAVNKVDGISQKIEDIFNKVGSLEQNIQKMDSMVNQLDKLTKQIELMRPPTEDERRRALAKDSYPFNITIDQYQNGLGPKTQTDLESRQNKMSMLDSLMSDYDETTIKNSFNA